jgi:hypothetical protein
MPARFRRFLADRLIACQFGARRYDRTGATKAINADPLWHLKIVKE